MKKITVFIDGDAIIADRPSGIGTATVSLIRALSENDNFTAQYQLRIIVAANKLGKIQRWQFNESVGIRVSMIPGRILNGLVRYNLLPPVDILYGKGIYLFTNFRNWPLVVSPSMTYIHDVSFRVYPQFIERKNLQFLERNVDRWIRRTTRVITVSSHAKKEIEKYYPDAVGRTEVVYNGVDDSFRLLDENDTKDILTTYGLEYKQYFMYLSNLEPRKNLEGVLSAYERFCDEHGKEKAGLLVVGGMSWASDNIQKKISHMKDVGFKIIKPSQYVKDEELPYLLAGAVALVHPAFYEGFGISPLQAMACGTQVIVSDVTSLPEIVGDAGRYVDPDDINSIADAMNESYRNRFIQNKRGVRRSRNFTWKKSAQHLADIINDLGRRVKNE